jgi:hypothetical protein
MITYNIECPLIDGKMSTSKSAYLDKQIAISTPTRRLLFVTNRECLACYLITYGDLRVRPIRR